MANAYSSLCDDFFVDMFVNTELDLPVQSDTVLAFFERIQKQYPSMASFNRRESSEFCLEEDRRSGQYRWVSLEVDRVGSGIVNPSDFGEVYSQDRFVLGLIPYMLDLSSSKAIDFSPSIVVALSDDSRTQARISVESKTSIYDPDKIPQALDEAISLSFTVRQYPYGAGRFDVLKSFENQCHLAEELMADRIVGNLVRPLINVIAQKRLI